MGWSRAASAEMRGVLASNEGPKSASRGILGRMLGGAALVALLTAVGVATAGFEAVGSVADLFAKGGLISSPDLTPTGGGTPTTILLLGSDRRAKTAIDYGPP